MTRPDLHPSQTSDLALLSNTASMPALSVVLVRAAAIWATWRKTAQTRKTLRTLEPHMLRDIGVSEAEAHREARKPFWMH